jgi:hypothetical protein
MVICFAGLLANGFPDGLAAFKLGLLGPRGFGQGGLVVIEVADVNGAFADRFGPEIVVEAAGGGEEVSGTGRMFNGFGITGDGSNHIAGGADHIMIGIVVKKGHCVI